MQEQTALFDGANYYARSEQEIIAQQFSRHPDEDYTGYWAARKKAKKMAEKYGIAFVVWFCDEYRFVDLATWQEKYKSSHWHTIGYHEKGNGFFD
jgi:hypothetical protein